MKHIEYIELNEYDIDVMFNDAKEKKVLLIGDLCLDLYYFCDERTGETSVETGYVVENATYTKTSLGGVGNVVANLASLGVGHISLCSAIGDDMEGREIGRLLTKHYSMDISLLFIDEELPTPTYLKIIQDSKEKMRIDKGKQHTYTQQKQKEYLHEIEKNIDAYDYIIINQQLRTGFMNEVFFKKLLQILRHKNIENVIIDTRDYAYLCDNFTLKMNDYELSKLMGDTSYGPLDDIPLNKVFEYLEMRHKQEKSKVICTLGNVGACYIENDSYIFARGFHILPPIDTVGAGDSYLAGYCVGMLSKTQKEKAICLGNATSAVTISKIFTTGTASPEEIKKTVSNAGYVYNPDCFSLTKNSDVIERVESFSKAYQSITTAIFDFDGTISVLREGWQEVMRETLVFIIQEKRDIDRSKICHDIDYLIHKTTGIQTISQMILFRKLLASNYGFQESELLDAMAYKEIYLSNLQKNIDIRKDNINKGILSPEDFLIKGSYQILERLFDMGISLYLASGTDHKEVMRETGILGVDKFFQGRIQGSVDDGIMILRKRCSPIL